MLKIIDQLRKRLNVPDAHTDRALLIEAMWDIMGEIQRINLQLNDPHGDDSGRDSKVPDADSFNELSQSIKHTVVTVLDKIGEVRA